jgi:hypothetical protein
MYMHIPTDDFALMSMTMTVDDFDVHNVGKFSIHHSG